MKRASDIAQDLVDAPSVGAAIEWTNTRNEEVAAVLRSILDSGVEDAAQIAIRATDWQDQAGGIEIASRVLEKHPSDSHARNRRYFTSVQLGAFGSKHLQHTVEDFEFLWNRCSERQKTAICRRILVQHLFRVTHPSCLPLLREIHAFLIDSEASVHAATVQSHIRTVELLWAGFPE